MSADSALYNMLDCSIINNNCYIFFSLCANYICRFVICLLVIITLSFKSFFLIHNFSSINCKKWRKWSVNHAQLITPLKHKLFVLISQLGEKNSRQLM